MPLPGRGGVLRARLRGRASLRYILPGPTTFSAAAGGELTAPELAKDPRRNNMTFLSRVRIASYAASK
jgi:hypothetical protein